MGNEVLNSETLECCKRSVPASQVLQDSVSSEFKFLVSFWCRKYHVKMLPVQLKKFPLDIINLISKYGKYVPSFVKNDNVMIISSKVNDMIIFEHVSEKFDFVSSFSRCNIPIRVGQDVKIQCNDNLVLDYEDSVSLLVGFSIGKDKSHYYLFEITGFGCRVFEVCVYVMFVFMLCLCLCYV